MKKNNEDQWINASSLIRPNHLIDCMLPPNDHWKHEYKRLREQGFTPSEIFEANTRRGPINFKEAVKKAMGGFDEYYRREKI